MNTIELRNNLTQKLTLLSDEQLKLISQLIEQFDLSQTVLTEETQKELISKWEYLVNNNQEIDESKPLSNDEIQIICQILNKENKTRPLGLAKGDFSIDESFNDPLPDDIVD
ncbi:MAG: hypothetical protein DSM107014_16485 [Gomphosphaeria aponina SAG 52.96 = DSM 107014]|uniref:DUF2281 domain-containing protein n=1 Tax=Gomphosphaeria aponina SAG 52.96 = DSM 107014 TaxID=1521640 RepID=A0A941JQT8_9CHRO|nr:hypothetical protein [Gomphosphaeria aponina SAG 52.96 = DSM 107014]